MSSPNRPSHLRLVLILLVTFFAYAPALRNDFTMDDRYVALGVGDQPREGNRYVSELHSPATYFSTHYWAGQSDSSRLLRPVTVMSFALRHHFFGDCAWVAHLANLLLHLLAVWLTYLMVRELGGSRLTAEVAALVFGLHAIHSEAVIGIVGRAELLGFCFGAAGLLVMVRSASYRLLGQGLQISAASALLFLAFASKENALAWAPFALAFGVARRAARGTPILSSMRSALLPAVAVIVPLFVFLHLRARMLTATPAITHQDILGLVNPLANADTVSRILTAFFVWGFALVQQIAPFDLSADYGTSVFPIIGGFGDPLALVSYLALGIFVTMLVMSLRYARQQPLLFSAVACFLGFSFLTSNVPLSIGTIYGERLYYTPSLGFAFAIGWVAQTVATRERLRTPLVALGGAWIGACVLVIVQRAGVWRDDAALFVHEARSQPRSVRMHLCAAAICNRGDQKGAALEHCKAAVWLDPGCSWAWLHLGITHLERDKFDLAIDAFERGIARSRPQSLNLIAEHYYSGYGIALAKKDRLAEALGAFERSLATGRHGLAQSKAAAGILARITHDKAVSQELRHRAARVGQRAWPAGPPK